MSRWETTVAPTAVARLAVAARRHRPEIPAAPPVLIGEGISTVTYGWSTFEPGWALRVSRRHPEPWTWRGGRRHEVGLSAELRRRGVPVPADATVVEEANGLPTAILERRIAGASLDADRFRSDPRLVARIAGSLDRIHSVDINHTVVSGVPRDDPAVDLAFLHGELGAGAVADICAALKTADPGLGAAARTVHDLWPLLELVPGGEWWGDPATAGTRLGALL